jgi:hypothetical protein
MSELNGLNRALHQAYVEFLEPLKETRSMRMRSTSRKQAGPVESHRYHLGPRLPKEWKTDSSSEEDTLPPSMSVTAVKARLSAAIRTRIAIRSASSLARSEEDDETQANPPTLQELDVYVSSVAANHEI